MEIQHKERIIIVIGTLSGMGGAERQAILLAENLIKKHQKDARILSFGGGNTEQKLKELEIPYDVFEFNFIGPFKQKIVPLIRLVFFLRKLKPDYLIPFITINSKFIGLIWKFTGARFACWNQRDEGREIKKTKIERISAGNVPVIISNSWEGRDALIKMLHIEPSKIRVINNGIVIPALLPGDITYWRKQLKLSPDIMIVSMIASISIYKDHKTLIKAWERVHAELTARNRKAVLVMAGHCNGLEKELKIMAFDLRIGNSIYFTGSTPHTNALIAASNLVVHSSNTEGCSNAVLEAMALQKAIVATNISGNLQALGTTYANVCLSDSNNAEDMALKITHLLENESLCNDIGKYNFERVSKEFSVDQMVNQYLATIKKYSN